MTLTKKCVSLRGSSPGFDRAAFTELMKREVGVSSEAAQNLTDRLLADETVIIWVNDLEKTVDEARSLGASVLHTPGNSHAN